MFFFIINYPSLCVLYKNVYADSFFILFLLSFAFVYFLTKKKFFSFSLEKGAMLL